MPKACANTSRQRFDNRRSIPSDRRPDDPASIASLRTDLAIAREEIARLRGDNDKLRHNTQRLLGQQLEQAVDGDLLARVDRLVAENHSLTEKLRASARDNGQLRKQIIELEERPTPARPEAQVERLAHPRAPRTRGRMTGSRPVIFESTRDILVTSIPIKFDYNFVTEEFPEWVGTSFNDNLKIILIAPNGAAR